MFDAREFRRSLAAFCDRRRHRYDDRWQRSTSSSLAAFARAKYFAINVLTADQRELSQRLSSNVADKFDGVGAVSGHGGIPLINGCAFDCANVRLGSFSDAGASNHDVRSAPMNGHYQRARRRPKSAIASELGLSSRQAARSLFTIQ